MHAVLEGIHNLQMISQSEQYGSLSFLVIVMNGTDSGGTLI
jgi:hypothetical protein